MSTYQIGLDSRNRITEFKLGVSLNSNREESTIAYAQLQTLKDIISGGDKRVTLTVDPVTGIKKYSVNLNIYYVVEMNAAAPKYIDVPYDPYPAVRWRLNYPPIEQDPNSVSAMAADMLPGPIAVNEIFDFKSSVSEEDYKSIWDSFGSIPRREFERMACDILSNVTYDKSFRGKSGEQILKIISWKNFICNELPVFLTASHLVDIFNRSNLEMCQKQGLTPSQWESLKTRSFSLRNIDQEAEKGIELVSKSPWARMWVDTQTKRQIFERRLELLPKTGDPMINLQRDLSLGALLQSEEWEKLDLICSMYEQLPTEMKDVFKVI